MTHDKTKGLDGCAKNTQSTSGCNTNLINPRQTLN